MGQENSERSHQEELRRACILALRSVNRLGRARLRDICLIHAIDELSAKRALEVLWKRGAVRKQGRYYLRRSYR